MALNRRSLLRTLAVGAGASALLAACGRSAPATPVAEATKPAAAPAATTAPAAGTTPAAASTPAAGTTPAAAATPAVAAKPAAGGKLIWTGWNAIEYYQPVVEQFVKENPDVQAEYVALPNYKKQLTMLAAGEQSDVIVTRDDDLAGFIDAGFVIPVDMSLSGMSPVKDDTFTGNLEAMTYKGKQYGLPYYTDFHTIMYNAELLDKAGFKAPPKSLDELKQQSLEIKKQGISDFPLRMWLNQEDNFKEPMYALMAASGGQFVDQDLKAVTDKPGSVLEKLLVWMTDAFQDSKFMDLANLQMSDEDNIQLLMTGKTVFHTANRYDLRRLNDPKQTPAAKEGQKVFKMMIMPGLESESKGTVSWTRQYTVNAKSALLDKAKLLQFFGGAKNKAGDYWTAKQWHSRFGLGFAYKSLGSDPTILKAEQTWGDPELFTKQKESAKPRDGLQTAWFSEWDNVMQAEWHKALLKQQSAQQSAANIAKKWDELRKQYGG